MNILSISISLFSICSLILVFIISKKYLQNNEEIGFVTYFEKYILLFEFYLNKAYDIIYKDRILIYSLEATKLDDKEFKEVARDFGKLFIQLIGPTLQRKLSRFYGDEETLMFNVIEFFNTKFENDEIRKTSVDNLTEENQSD